MNDNPDFNDGYGAHAQNAKQKDNPFIERACRWDEGWRQREEQRLSHTLQKDKIKNIPVLSIGLIRNSEVKDV